MQLNKSDKPKFGNTVLRDINRELGKYQIMLEKAIIAEDFEKASKIRDKINQIIDEKTS